MKPMTSATDHAVEMAMEFADIAPSPRNLKPWEFRRVSGSSFDIYRDRRRHRPVADPTDRELVISCGVAAGYARVAIEAMQSEAKVTLLPYGDNEDLLARVSIEGALHTELPANAQAVAAALRHVSWEQFSSVKPSAGATHELQQAGSTAGCRLLKLAEDAAAEVEQMIRWADRAQLQDPEFVAELTRMPKGRPSLVPLERRPWPYRRQETKTGGGTLFVLATPTDSCRDWLEAGLALTEVMLVATRMELALSLANQPLQIPQTRSQIAALLQTEAMPQLLMRIGREAPGE